MTLDETLRRRSQPGIRDSRAEDAIQSRDTSGSDGLRHELGLPEESAPLPTVSSGPRRPATLLPTVALAVITYLDHRLAENPHGLSIPLSCERPHLCSAQNGEYRILMRLQAQLGALWIIRIDHRAHAHRAR